jgi:hypothetical protein
VIDRGKAVAEGSPADLVGSAGAGMIVEGRVAGPLAAEALPPIPGLAVSGADFRCRTTTPARAATAILAAFERQGVEIVSLRIGRPTLEDVILGLIER